MLHGSLANGPGLRDVIWLQGCTLECPGCFNQHMWDHSPRHLIRVTDLANKLSSRVGIIEGVTISGGDPVEQAPALSNLLSLLRDFGLTTMVYTGYTIEALQRIDNPHVNALLTHTDILIDGPYLEKRRTMNRQWRGSTNQRIHFLSEQYSSDILTKESDQPAQERIVFLNGEVNTIVDTGISE